jgi:hypothetical protein
MASGTSYNGWPASDSKSAIGVDEFGDAYGVPFPGGVKAGDVTTVLGYVCVQLHYRVEPCVSGWDWGYTYKQNVNNPSQLSCHASGTAVDYNAPNHPNGSGGTFTDTQRGEIYAILDEVQGSVNWLEGYDEMHFEICVGSADLARVAASLPAIGPSPGPVPPIPESEDGVITQLYVKGTDGAIYVTADLITRRHIASGDRLNDALWNAGNVLDPSGKPVVVCYMLSGGKWQPFTSYTAQGGKIDQNAVLDQFGVLVK